MVQLYSLLKKIQLHAYVAAVKYRSVVAIGDWPGKQGRLLFQNHKLFISLQKFLDAEKKMAFFSIPLSIPPPSPPLLRTKFRPFSRSLIPRLPAPSALPRQRILPPPAASPELGVVEEDEKRWTPLLEEESVGDLISICDPWACCSRDLRDFDTVSVGRGSERGGAEGGGEDQEGSAGPSPRCPRLDQEGKGGSVVIS